MNPNRLFTRVALCVKRQIAFLTWETGGLPRTSSVPGMTEIPRATAALEELMGHEAWAVIRLRDSPTVTLVGGALSHLEKLADIPLEEGVPEQGRRLDRLAPGPFRQVRERGFVAHDDHTPLAVVDIETEREVALEDLLEVLP